MGWETHPFFPQYNNLRYNLASDTVNFLTNFNVSLQKRKANSYRQRAVMERTENSTGVDASADEFEYSLDSAAIGKCSIKILNWFWL